MADELKEQRAREIATCTTLNYYEALEYVAKLQNNGVPLDEIPTGTRQFMENLYQAASILEQRGE